MQTMLFLYNMEINLPALIAGDVREVQGENTKPYSSKAG